MQEASRPESKEGVIYMAPCACSGSRRGGNQEWVYDNGAGDVTVFGTQVQAKAAQIHNGNTGEVRPK